MYDLDKKIIFTHPRKCGGTSIESILGFLSLRKKNPGIHSFKHSSLEMHIDKIKLEGLDPSTFFKFSIIRNPWSRAVSFYNHNKYKEFYYYTNEATDREIPTHVRDASCMTFKEFVLKYYEHDFNSKVSTKPYMFLGDKFSLDYIIRLENLKEDLLRIKDLLQIGLDVDIPCLNNTDEYAIRKNYQSYYDLETRNIIEKLFEWDINTFGYKFN